MNSSLYNTTILLRQWGAPRQHRDNFLRNHVTKPFPGNLPYASSYPNYDKQ